ncbi:hypothetical protein H7H73_22910 [Mycobacterium rufum]|uniref:Uncharacterized protein n=1 Tax=Mycolicibacterium rufum TaxID=318424 RepID=A0A9X2YGC5_9MYCO|nr:hypothetical protein [Mycolicibacterium rufum]
MGDRVGSACRVPSARATPAASGSGVWPRAANVIASANSTCTAVVAARRRASSLPGGAASGWWLTRIVQAWCSAVAARCRALSWPGPPMSSR